MGFSKTIKTMLGVLFIFGALFLLYGSLYSYYRMTNIFTIFFFCFLFISGLAALILPIDTIEKSTINFLISRPSFIFNAFFVLLYGSIMCGLIALLIKPTLLAPIFNQKIDVNLTHEIIEAQILGCICLAGMAGGIISQLFSSKDLHSANVSNNYPDNIPSLTQRFWNNMICIIASLFVSLVIFLLVRAGILKQVEIDTFNVYGVTGFAAISGYFSKNILVRFKRLYEGIMGN